MLPAERRRDAARGGGRVAPRRRAPLRRVFQEVRAKHVAALAAHLREHLVNFEALAKQAVREEGRRLHLELAVRRLQLAQKLYDGLRQAGVLVEKGPAAAARTVAEEEVGIEVGGGDFGGGVTQLGRRHPAMAQL